MPPKFDPSQVIDVFVRVTGGEVGAASSLVPKIGPLGLSRKKIEEDIAKETAKDWKGLRVTVKLTVQNLLGEGHRRPLRRRSGHQGAQGAGARSSMAKDLSGTVKKILGTCVSVGCTVDGKDPKDLQQEINDGDVEVDALLRICSFDARVYYTNGIKFLMFKCDWVDPEKGVKQDEYNFTFVNFNHLLHNNNMPIDEPFILSTQADQVWYVPDPLQTGWNVVMKITPRDHFDIYSTFEAELFANQQLDDHVPT
ncbi:hypothetical protein BUALT_Bualt14G0052300 [Buddleja alternifolia]|uniref:60S ribosomal protein L12 n=1 Tax=Buddleja alternifolia TaxID=168488 RepID=A0AAV6WGS2_9LAMI|nr:hypothetical protein BUALT_Bualt14G0052300 [Buddleja alternifolia]